MKNLSLNIKKKTTQAILASFILISVPATLSAYQDKCEITENHTHIYKDEYGRSKYLDSEKEKKGWFKKTDEYVSLTEEEKKLLKFTNKEQLLPIEANIDLLSEMKEVYQTHLEYEYTDSTVLFDPITMTVLPANPSLWTTDSNHPDLTGQVRIVSYQYQAYKVIKNAKGNYEVVASPLVDNLEEVMDEYPYFTTASAYEVTKDYIENIAVGFKK